MSYRFKAAINLDALPPHCHTRQHRIELWLAATRLRLRGRLMNRLNLERIRHNPAIVGLDGRPVKVGIYCDMLFPFLGGEVGVTRHRHSRPKEFLALTPCQRVDGLSCGHCNMLIVFNILLLMRSTPYLHLLGKNCANSVMT